MEKSSMPFSGGGEPIGDGISIAVLSLFQMDH